MLLCSHFKRGVRFALVRPSVTIFRFSAAKASKSMHQVCIEKSPNRHLHFPYIRAENSSTACTSIYLGFCKMLWYYPILFILNQSGQLWIKEKKNKQYFYWFNCILQSFKLSLLTGLSELWFNFVARAFMSYGHIFR